MKILNLVQILFHQQIIKSRTNWLSRIKHIINWPRQEVSANYESNQPFLSIFLLDPLDKEIYVPLVMPSFLKDINLQH